MSRCLEAHFFCALCFVLCGERWRRILPARLSKYHGNVAISAFLFGHDKIKNDKIMEDRIILESAEIEVIDEVSSLGRLGAF